MGLHEIKNLLHSKGNGHRLKRQHTEWEKIYISDKGLITRIYRELKKLNFQKINDPMKKWSNELNRAFSKEKVQMAKKQMKKCSTLYFPGHIGNANQNHNKMLPHSCYLDGYHQEHKQQQMRVRM
jgi:hypothetical protein